VVEDHITDVLDGEDARARENERAFLVGALFFQHGSHHAVGADNGGIDVLSAEFAGHGQRKGPHREFRGAVQRKPRKRREPGNRSDVDDLPLSLSRHDTSRGLSSKNHTFDIDVEMAIHVFNCDLIDPGRMKVACDVHENVNPAKLRRRFGHALFPLLGVAHIEPPDPEPICGPAQALCLVFELVERQISCIYAIAPVQERSRQMKPDSAR